MIERVDIQNYRSCLETSIELQPDLSVLIGPNGSGKTNVLQALLLLRQLTQEPALRHHGEQALDESRLKMWFSFSNRSAILTADLRIYTDDNNLDQVVSADESWYAKDYTGSSKRIKAPMWLGRYMDESGALRPRARNYLFHFRDRIEIPESFRLALITISRYMSDIKYYSASQFTNPSRCPVSVQVETGERSRRGIGVRGHAKFLYDLFSEYKMRDSSNYDQFLEVIGPDGIGLVDKIRFKEIPTSSIEYSVRSGGRVRKEKRQKIIVIPQFSIGRNSLSPSQLSEGTFKSITLLFYLMTESSTALMIEEPEVCVHHGLLSSIVELIKNYSQQKQIIMSTHSDFVLDQLEPRHVYRVERVPRVGTKVTHLAKSLSSKEIVALREYLDTQGNLGEYWRHGGLE